MCINLQTIIVPFGKKLVVLLQQMDGLIGKGELLSIFWSIVLKELFFLKSIDVSHASKSIDLLFKFFKDVVLRVGPKNVVHIVTYNATNYVVASRLLEKEFPKLFWSPCAAYRINLMLQDMGKLVEVSEDVSHA